VATEALTQWLNEKLQGNKTIRRKIKNSQVVKRIKAKMDDHWSCNPQNDSISTVQTKYTHINAPNIFDSELINTNAIASPYKQVEQEGYELNNLEFTEMMELQMKWLSK
jgi:hypothetical protein